MNSIYECFIIEINCVCFRRCKALVVGGGTGGCSIAAKLSSDYSQNDCIVLEPSDDHYYQPMFTMIGGGMRTLSQCRRRMSTVLPKKANWIKDAAAKFNPNANEVITKQGHIITYDFLIIAVGLQLCYRKVVWFELYSLYLNGKMKIKNGL